MLCCNIDLLSANVLISRLADRNREQPEGSIFNSCNTDV